MIVGVVLAAGAGIRIGQAKAFLRVGASEESFVARACRVLGEAGLREVIVVVSAEVAPEVREGLPGTRVLINEDPGQGQLSSLQTALAALGAGTEAIAVLPVDVPLVRGETIRALVSAWERTREPVVRPVSGGRHGHPVILDQRLFPELQSAPRSEGARFVVRRHVTAAGEVETADEGAFIDIDTAEDYARAFGRLPESVRIR